MIDIETNAHPCHRDILRIFVTLCTTCIIALVVFGGSGMVVFCVCKLVTVG